MAQNRELCDFSNFNSLEEKENFIKDIIMKQLNLSHISVAAFPSDGKCPHRGFNSLNGVWSPYSLDNVWCTCRS